jgi:hypothetical protein
MNIPKKIIQNIKNKFLNLDDYNYVAIAPESLKLYDKVIIYNTGDQWKIVSLNLMLSYPIIYDKYSLDEETYDITIILCPVTLRCVIFKGLFEFETYQEYRMILREKNTETHLPVDLGMKIDNKYLIQSNRRLEVMILTLRSALMTAPDAIYLNYEKKSEHVINLEYYSNKLDIGGNELDGLIHPKTLIYVIQYKTYNTGEDRISLVLGKDAVKNEVTGYDVKKSGLHKYLSTHKQKIINRDGYIMPMLWYIAKDVYKSSRLVYIY